MLIFDSEAFPEGDRAEALTEALSGVETPQTVTFSTSRPIRHRMEVFELGTGVHLLRNTGTPIHLVRSTRHVRLGTREEMALYVQSRGEALITAGGTYSRQSGQLSALDVSRPYAMRQIGDSDNSVLLIEFGRLGLPVDLIRAAIPLIGSSPLCRLIREHLLRLAVDLPADVAEMTGRATVDLIAALVATVCCDQQQAREVLNATEPGRIAAYIDEHLSDAKLTAGQIAAAHAMSARELTAMWRRAHDATPADWIAQRRLERARQMLTDPARALASVDDIAYGCGFSDAADFSHWFRAAYGISPQDFLGPAQRRSERRGGPRC